MEDFIYLNLPSDSLISKGFRGWNQCIVLSGFLLTCQKRSVCENLGCSAGLMGLSICCMMNYSCIFRLSPHMPEAFCVCLLVLRSLLASPPETFQIMTPLSFTRQRVTCCITAPGLTSCTILL